MLTGDGLCTWAWTHPPHVHSLSLITVSGAIRHVTLDPANRIFTLTTTETDITTKFTNGWDKRLGSAAVMIQQPALMSEQWIAYSSLTEITHTHTLKGSVPLQGT